MIFGVLWTSVSGENDYYQIVSIINKCLLLEILLRYIVFYYSLIIVIFLNLQNILSSILCSTISWWQYDTSLSTFLINLQIMAGTESWFFPTATRTTHTHIYITWSPWWIDLKSEKKTIYYIYYLYIYRIVCNSLLTRLQIFDLSYIV